MELIFYWTLFGLWMAAKLFYKGLIYIPLLFTGYILSTHILAKKDNGLWWVLVTILIAYLLYLMVFFLKGIMLCLKGMKFWGWIPLLLFCIAFTCIMPVWMIQSMLSNLIQNKIVVWILSLTFAGFVYMKYQFTTDKAPGAAVPFYRAGIDLAFRLFKKSKPVY